MEPDPSLFVRNVVEVFREVRRVLRKDGVCFVNLGDSYACTSNGRSAADTKAAGNDDCTFRDKPFGTAVGGLKPKDLCGMPWEVALALRRDGWYLRSDIIWSKANPMPESVRDRPTRAHEYVFLLTRSDRYFWDADSVREEAKYGRREWRGSSPHETYGAGMLGIKTKRSHVGGDPSVGRNMRSVLHLPTEPMPETHFATFPSRLITPFIKAGTSERGCCPACGAPWRRVTKPTEEYAKHLGGDWSDNQQDANEGRGHFALPDGTRSGQRGVKRGAPSLTASYETVGWQPSCACYDEQYRADYPKARRERNRRQRDLSGDWWRRVRKRAGLPHWATEPCIVLDIFSGSGTTGVVAAQLGRRAILIDLKREYLDIAARRIEKAERKRRDTTLTLPFDGPENPYGR